jgi:arylsulfatase A-like enzyme
MTQRFSKLLIVLLLGSCCFTCTQEKKKTPKAVFIIVDGIPADVVEKLNPPTLAEISKEGGFTHAYVGGIKGAYNETPTISAPGYIDLLTGAWANKHNVWDNDIAAPNYNYWNVFRIAEKNDSSISTAVFSTWLDNRTKLIGEGLNEAGGIKLDYSFDGLEHDTVKYPHDDNAEYIRKIDDAVSDEAARYISEKGPDLSWVYLEFSDDMGHRYGDSQQFYDAINGADQRIKKIWDAIKSREETFGEDWLIVVTTDHGRDAATGKDHGGQSDRERGTWIATNSKNLNDRFKQTPAVVDILPSIFNHLNIQVPDHVKKEIDGVPFIGNVEVSDLRAELDGETISLTWKDFGKPGNLEIFVAETNHFKVGGEDEYKKVGEAPISDKKFEFKRESASDFYKILVKTENHYANTWIVQNKKVNDVSE